MKIIGTIVRHPNFQRIANGKVLFWTLLFLIIYAPLTYAQMVSSSLKQSLTGDIKPAAKTTLICTREIHLKQGVDPAAFEKWIIEYWNPEWKDWIPGYESYVDKIALDQKEPQYYYCLKFNVKASAVNAYDYIDWHRELIYYKPTKYLYDELFEYIESGPFFYNQMCRDI